MKPRKPKPQQKATQKPRARELFLQGVTLADIAQRLKVSLRSVNRWKSEDKGTPQDWDQARLPADQMPRPNLISFDRTRGEDKPKQGPRVNLAKIDYDSLDGRIQAIDELLDATRMEILSPTSPQQYSAAINGFNKLLESRDRARPIDKVALLMAVIERYRDPADLLADLKEQGFGGRKSA